jgi:DNA-binding NarL/FixJ family response regulator
VKKILIVDDHDVVRDGVKRIFGNESITFGEAGTASSAIQLVENEPWDAVVLDLTLGDSNGLDVLKQMKQIRPRLPVLILSLHSEAQYARRAFKAGASGYVTKDTPRNELVKAIDKVIGGGKYVSEALAELLVVDLERGVDGPLHGSLSDREFEVMLLIASGRTVGEIADLLALSAKTISTYRARILEKMAMKTNAELTFYAIHAGLVT